MTTTRQRRNTTPARRPAAALTRRLPAVPLLLAALSLLAVLFVGAPSAQAQQGHPAPQNVQVVPGDGTLTVTWDVSPRDGFDDHQIRHALRWSQEAGVWANPADPEAGGPEDGIPVDGGVYSYTITGPDQRRRHRRLRPLLHRRQPVGAQPPLQPVGAHQGRRHHARRPRAPAADAAPAAGPDATAGPDRRDLVCDADGEGLARFELPRLLRQHHLERITMRHRDNAHGQCSHLWQH